MLSTPKLIEALAAPIAIPIVPFRGGHPAMTGFCLNVRYLMEHNHLDYGRRRVVSISSVSLLQHLNEYTKDRVVQKAGETMGDDGVLISGVITNPLVNIRDRVRAQSRFTRPPDAYLLMPVEGVVDPLGIYNEFLRLANQSGEEYGARFLLYLRSSDHLQVYARLICECEYIIGAQIGTHEHDVETMVQLLGSKGVVIWGMGDRSTRAAQCGSRGHTSGVAGVFVRLSDEISNAQRRQDYDESYRLEALVNNLEEIRFQDGRRYSYSALAAAMRLGRFTDVESGDGTALFNPSVPPEVAQKGREAIAPLMQYH